MTKNVTKLFFACRSFFMNIRYKVSLLVVMSLTSAFIKAQSVRNEDVVSKAIQEVEYNWPIGDFCEADKYSIYKTTIDLKDGMLNIKRLKNLRFTKPEQQERHMNIIEKLMQSNDYVKYFAYNVESLQPGFLRDLSERNLTLTLSFGILDYDEIFSQTLIPSELGKMAQSIPKDMNEYNLLTDIKLRNVFSYLWPSIPVSFTVVRSNSFTSSQNEETGGVRLSRMYIEKNRYINDVVVNDKLMEEFIFQGKNKVKSGFRRFNFNGDGVPFITNTDILVNAGIKEVVFRFHKEASENCMEVEYSMDEYTAITNDNNGTTQQSDSRTWDFLKSSETKPLFIDERSLISVKSISNCTTSLTVFYEKNLAKHINDNYESRKTLTSYILVKGMMNEWYDKKNMDYVTLHFTGQELDCEDRLSRKQVADILCMDKSDFEHIQQNVSNIYLNAPSEKSYSDGGGEIQIQSSSRKVEKINGIFKGEKDKRTHHVAISMEYVSQSPAFERACNEFLFNDSISQTIKECVISYNHSFNNVNGEKKSDYDNSYVNSNNDSFSTIRIRLLSNRPGAYASYKAWYTKEGKKSSKFVDFVTDTLCAIYDATSDKFLTLDDVLAPEKVKDIKKVYFEGNIQMSATPYALTYKYKSGGSTVSETIPYLDESCFNYRFLELVGWPETFQKQIDGTKRNLFGREQFDDKDSLSSPQKRNKDIRNNKTVVKDRIVVDDAAQNSTQVLEVVEQMPSFAGGTVEREVVDPISKEQQTIKETFPPGENGLMLFLSKMIKYPVVAEENGIQGKVVCTFVVNVDGSISDVKVIKSVDPSLDKEAIRVLKSMPKWVPGKQKGKVVKVKYTLPVTFRLK